MPDFKVEIRARLAELQLSPVREAEIVEELSQHLEQEYERALSCGASDDEARRQVLEQLNASDLLGRELKHVERRVSQNRSHWDRKGRSISLPICCKICATACAHWRRIPRSRSLLFSPSHWASVQTAQFSVWSTQCYCAPCRSRILNQLVMLWENAAHLGFPRDTPSPANFLDWQKQAISFTGMAAMSERSFNLTGVGEPERLEGRRVSANLFELLGVSALLGRTFVPEDDKPGTHVVLLSHSFWQRRFGSDPARHRSRTHSKRRELHCRWCHAALRAIAWL